MEKEIEVMPFMSREQAKRDINSSQRTPLNNKVLERVELQRRKQNNSNRDIFNELNETNYVYKKNIKEEKRQNINTIKVYAGVALASIILMTSGAAAIKYQNKPIRVAVTELASDTGYYLNSEDEVWNGKMTQEELVDYAIKNNLTIEQLDGQISKLCNREHLDEDVMREKMEETNPEVFKSIR